MMRHDVTNDARFTRVKSVEICLGKANVDVNAVEEERYNGHLRSQP